MNQAFLRWLNLLGFIAVIGVNFLAEYVPLNGKTTAEISDSFPVLLTPAGYVFVIWGLIYTLLAAFIIYQWLPANSNKPTVKSVGPWFLVSCLFNCGWIVLWHFLFIYTSLLDMLGLLVSLTMIYQRVAQAAVKPILGERIFVRLPFSPYLAWICVATIVNVSVVLYRSGWNGFGLSGEIWTVIMLVVSGLLAIGISLRYRDIPFILVFIWAFIGIAVKNAGTPLIVTTASVVSIVLTLLFGFWLLVQRIKRKSH